MEIINKDLQKLDEKVTEFYKFMVRYSKDLTNLYGKEIYEKQFNNLLSLTNRINPDSEFDSLILKNIKSNLTITDLIINYFNNPKFRISTEKFFDKIAGDGTWAFLEQNLKDLPWKAYWETSEATENKNLLRVDARSKESVDIIDRELPIIKKNIINYCVEEGFLPKDFKFKFLFIPHFDENASASWRPATKILNLYLNNFTFYNKDGKTILDPVYIYNSIFHELIGHGLHQMFSSELPSSINFSEIIYSITPTKSVAEGIAEIRAEESFKLLEKKLKVEKGDLELYKNLIKFHSCNRYEQMFFSLLKSKELKERKFDGAKEVLKLTKNYPLSQYYKYAYNKTFFGTLCDMGHTFGRFHYQKMKDFVEQQHGKGILDQKEFRNAPLRGLWSWEVYPEAVSYFVKELKK
ncbi:MAG: hypothetical protein PHD81_03830 [Candidatus Nanoarchaeia archaeon]|nr:hypothetical protein [Candidatus Nanoarchaeia archaeon]MDD5588212.1 hypothetical protein [Candidatus Nanoarchaeia archaeon]